MRRSITLAAVLVMLGGMLFANKMAKATEYPELLISQGIREMNRGGYHKALERFSRAAQMQPRDPEVRYFVGLAYSRLEDYPSAIAAFEKVLKLDPAHRKVRYELGVAYFFMEDYPKAMSSFKRAHKEDPSNALVLLYLGATYQRMGEFKRSIRNLRKAKELDPKLAQISEFHLAMAYMGLGRDEKAIEALWACIEMDPGSEVALMAQEYLERVPEKEKPRKRWDVSATLSFQYDDNVILKPEGLTTAELITRESDYRGVGFVWGEYRFLEGAPWLGGVRASFYQSIHHRLHEFDVTYAAGSIYGGYRGAVMGFPYTVEADYEYEYTWLDDRSYLERQSGIAYLDFSETPYLLTQLSYRGQKKDFFHQPFLYPADDRDAFNHRAGLTQYLFFWKRTGYIHGGYFYDRDNADGSNWDYKGHFASAGFYTPLLYGVGLRGKGEYYRQNFDNMNTTFLKKRKDTEWTFHVALDRDLWKYLNVSAYYVHQNHHSNIDAFKYDRNIYFVSITGRF
jgi:Flp pilus assembly protein TadD